MVCGEEGLVARNQDVVEGKQTHKHVILDDFSGKVFEEQVGFFFIHIQAQVTNFT